MNNVRGVVAINKNEAIDKFCLALPRWTDKWSEHTFAAGTHHSRAQVVASSDRCRKLQAEQGKTSLERRRGR